MSRLPGRSSDISSALGMARTRTWLILPKKISKESAHVRTIKSASGKHARKASRRGANTSKRQSSTHGRYSGGRYSSSRKGSGGKKPKALWVQIRNQGKPPEAPRRRRIRHRSRLGERRFQEYLKARLEYIDAHRQCEVCHNNPATEIHHKAGRIGPRLTDPRFFMALCRPDHRRIHDNPSWARSQGYILSWTAPNTSS